MSVVRPSNGSIMPIDGLGIPGKLLRRIPNGEIEY